MLWKGLVEEYKAYLPVTETTPVVTLNEGNTPLISIQNLADHLGISAQWYVKFEGLNPTGSFKDRGMCMAVTKAKEDGMKTVICASTGNTSASAAAYAAKANMDCIVLIPKGKIALGKLSQAMMHGARVIQIDGNFDLALTIVREIAEKEPIALVNSVNPYRIEGQKTGAFEIIDQLGNAPNYHFMPVGNAGNITAYWKGYNEYFNLKKSSRRPKMMGFQAEGSAPIVRGHVIENPETIATAIRIGNPASWTSAETARDESGGHIGMVSDDIITQYQQLLAQKDGVFCEPACAVAIAGVAKMAETISFKNTDTIVSIITGHGLKDPDQAIKVSVTPTVVEASYAAVSKAIFST
ncbi:MAG: threonine synthase [Candidatus Marinamargulisbacteria bacterium]